MPCAIVVGVSDAPFLVISPKYLTQFKIWYHVNTAATNILFEYMIVSATSVRHEHIDVRVRRRPKCDKHFPAMNHFQLIFQIFGSFQSVFLPGFRNNGQSDRCFGANKMMYNSTMLSIK